MNQLSSKTLLAILTTAAFTSGAQESGGWGRFGLSYRATFNISAEFSGIGGFRAGGSPSGLGVSGPPGSIVGQYDDGFIGVDISGNAGDRTWYWGYNESTQIVGDAIHMHSISSPGVNSGETDGDPQHGFELSYQLPLAEGDKWKIGLDSAFNWTDVDINDRRTLVGTITTRTHAFGLSGVIPPMAPYTGTVNGPGAIIGAVPVDLGSSNSGGALITGHRAIDASLYGLRVGPYADFELSERLALQLGVGVSAALMDSEFSFNETIVSGSTTRFSRGRGEKTDWLFGAYARAQINLALCDRVSLFGGVEFNHLDDFDQSVSGKNASVDFGSMLSVNGGVSVSF